MLSKWFGYDERLRFIIMAAVNMVFRYGLFVVLELVPSFCFVRLVYACKGLTLTLICFYSLNMIRVNTEISRI